MCKLVQLYDDNSSVLIADIKKPYIVNAVNSLKSCSLIDEIYLFGSCLESRCTDTSDIDIALVGKVAYEEFLSSKEYAEVADKIYSFGLSPSDFQDYDILYFNSTESNDTQIYREAIKGAKVYG